jgi:hypothetical protein
MANNTTVVGISTSLDLEFFKYWVDFLFPIHKLSRRDADVTASLLYRRHQLSEVISNEDVLDAVLLSTEQRRIMRAQFGLTQQNFQVIMAKLRAKHVIVNKKINKRFIPNLSKDADEYKLTIHFRMPNEKHEEQQNI